MREPRVTFSTVDRYGWTWQRTNPSKGLLLRELVAAWKHDQATEVRIELPGRRPVTV